MQYASKWDRHTLSLRDKGRYAHSPGYRSLNPKHAVREGLMALAEDKRPEATLLITFELVCIATQEGVIIYVGRVSVGSRVKL
jgi:hypothetical protein